MTDAELDLIVDPNLLFTVIVNLMWHLHALATERALQDIALDLLAAISELECGPWTHVGGSIAGVGLPMATEGALLDELLSRLRELSPGLGARLAVSQAQRWLSGPS